MRNRIKAAYARAVLFIIGPALARSGYVEYSGVARLDTLEADMGEFQKWCDAGLEECRSRLDHLDKERASASEQTRQLDEKLARDREEFPVVVAGALREARARGVDI